MSSILSIKPKDLCKWDLISLGEVMLRLDPGDSRIKSTRCFKVWEGGGEYNVARGLKKCFGMNTTVLTGLVENEIGFLLQDLINQGNVDMSYAKWFPFDGIGRNSRIGLNFTEKGFGLRNAITIYDRGYSAASMLKKSDFDWKKVFENDGARWFHTGGIFAALSTSAPDLIIEAMKNAKNNHTIISYDLNYRSSLWKDFGGKNKAIEINRNIIQFADVVFGNEEDFSVALGFNVKGLGEKFNSLDPANFKAMIKEVVREFNNIKAVVTTLRNVITANINDWSGILYYDGNFYQSRLMEKLEIFDRVGGGDSFNSGIIFGFLTEKDPSEIIEYGVAHGALAMTTPGDTSMASLKEVEKIIRNSGARIER